MKKMAQMDVSSSRERSETAFMQVLTNKSLFRHVVSLMNGLPLVIVQFSRAQRRSMEARDKVMMLQWLERHLDLTSSYTFETDFMDIAVGYTKGGAEVMEWIIRVHSNVKTQVTAWALRLAAYNGELLKMKWLHEHGFQGFSCTTADDAACAGHTNVLKFLLENRREGCSSRALDQAATHGHIDVVRYLFSFIHGRTSVEQHRVMARASFAMTKAALCGHAEIVGALGRRHCTPLNNTLLDVVATGELQVLKESCRYSNEGCLVEARRRAKTLGYVDLDTFLRTQIAPTAWPCRLHRHSRSGRRRCQRKTKVGSKFDELQ
ncbi:unnamed protein product [Peronospora belbahrii]|uniref:Ankyrin repeat-containing domain n=1 Tax=Peronospora belbahrii TaxID=622444 RepID=A0AAU9KZG1_9STRA|nr:unnamed protein product [Peronospora belbahrii]CAH0516331.1 unnamed protein product [Peronospora belbahrii]